jgi:hypothetical protein
LAKALTCEGIKAGITDEEMPRALANSDVAVRFAAD